MRPSIPIYTPIYPHLYAHQSPFIHPSIPIYTPINPHLYTHQSPSIRPSIPIYTPINPHLYAHQSPFIRPSIPIYCSFWEKITYLRHDVLRGCLKSYGWCIKYFLPLPNPPLVKGEGTGFLLSQITFYLMPLFIS